MEEGVRQFVNNYVKYVNDQITGDAFLIVRAIIGGMLRTYLYILEEKLAKQRIGPGLDRRSADLPLQMAVASRSMRWYSPTLPPDLDREREEDFFNEQVAQLRSRHKELSRKMGIEA